MRARRDRGNNFIQILGLVQLFLAYRVLRCASSACEPKRVMRPKIILDCDPAGYVLTGLDVDDDLTILNALSLHKRGIIEILGVTITGGNAPIDYTYPNALALIRRRAGIPESEVGIYRGGIPLVSTSFQYQSNFDILNVSRVPQSDATIFLIETVLNSPQRSITILSIGPLTNLASAFLIEPQIAKRVNKVVFMGGTLTSGLPYDLNIRTDPVAAAIVWNYMDCLKNALPIETCIQAVFGSRSLEEVEKECRPKRSNIGHSMTPPIICSLLWRMKIQRHVMPWFVNSRFSSVTKEDKSPWIDEGFVLWDLVALWAVVRPQLFSQWTYYNATVLPSSESELSWRSGLTIQARKDDSVSLDDLSMEEFFSNMTSMYSIGNKGRILVPLKIKDERVLQGRIMEHLYLPHADSFRDSKPIMPYRASLGSLPRIIVTIVGLVLVSFILKWSRDPIGR